MSIKKQAALSAADLSSIRRAFHLIPEPGAGETATGRLIRSYIDSWGIPCRFPVADTGIMAVLQGQGGGEGRTVALRADMDALPIAEPKDRPYTSRNPGMMHACGHDAHITIALGAAYALKQMEDRWSGTVKIFFQPAEETIGGAKRMVEEGVMDDPHVDYVTGLHVTPAWEAGEIEVKYGKLNASSDEVRLILHGKSCHGAYPDTGTDAVVMAGALITSLQALVSRSVSPLDSAALTFGIIRGGAAGNIVADRVELTGTLRTTDPQTRAEAIAFIRRQTEHICAAFGGRGEAVITPGYAALINTDELVDLLVLTAAPIVGGDHIHWKEAPSLGVEDFSFFLDEAPGVFYHLGCANQARGITAPLHSDRFDIDEACLPLGVRLQTELTLALLKRP